MFNRMVVIDGGSPAFSPEGQPPSILAQAYVESLIGTGQKRVP